MDGGTLQEAIASGTLWLSKHRRHGGRRAVDLALLALMRTAREVRTALRSQSLGGLLASGGSAGSRLGGGGLHDGGTAWSSYLSCRWGCVDALLHNVMRPARETMDLAAAALTCCAPCPLLRLAAVVVTGGAGVAAPARQRHRPWQPQARCVPSALWRSGHTPVGGVPWLTGRPCQRCLPTVEGLVSV